MRQAVLSRLRQVIPIALVSVGLMLMAIGIGMTYEPAGWMAAGVGLLLLERWLSDSGRR